MKLPVTWSLSHPVTLSHSHTLIRSLGHSVTMSFCHSISTMLHNTTDWLTYNIRTYRSASQTKVKVSLNLLEASKTAWSVFICLSLFLPVFACHCLILLVWLGLTGPYLVYWSLPGLTRLYWAFTGPYWSPLCLPCSHWSLLGLLLRFTGSHRVTRS